MRIELPKTPLPQATWRPLLVYGKPYLDHNAHTHALARIVNDMKRIDEDLTLSEMQRLLARQIIDLALALYNTIKESNNGQL